MANKGFIEISGNEGWVNVAQAMQAKYSAFSFENDKTYVLQIVGANKICITSKNLPEEKEGFERDGEPFSYTHTVGETLFAKCKYSSNLNIISINISD